MLSFLSIRWTGVSELIRPLLRPFSDLSDAWAVEFSREIIE